MVYLKNHKGLNAELFMTSVITEHGLAFLDKQVKSGQASDQMARFVDLAMTLPTHKSLGLRGVDYPGLQNFTTPPSAYGMHTTPARGVLMPGGFKVSPPTTDANKYLSCSPDPKGLGWEQVPELCGLLEAVAPEAARLGVHIEVANLEKVSRQLSKVKWSIEQTSVQSMLSAECCVVYRVNAEGFVDPKSQTVDLPHARLFENQVAAQRAIDTGKWTDAVIAKVSVKIEGLAPDQRLPDKLGLLDEVLVQRVAQVLDAATESAEQSPNPPQPRRRF